MGPFQNLVGMSQINHSIQKANSKIKREKINGYPVAVICGCSRQCGFAYIQICTEHTDIDDEKRYQNWLKNSYERDK